MIIVRIVLALLLFLQPLTACGKTFPLTFQDSTQQQITLHQPPVRVVSLVPSITEILFALGAEDRLRGLTYHFSHKSAAAGKSLVGGFSNPDPALIRALAPDLIFYADLHQSLIATLDPATVAVQLNANSIAEGFEQIRLLGRIFNASETAAQLLAEQRRLLQLMADKTAEIPLQERPRVVQLMSRDTLMVPGDDSFQNEYIRRAGGIAPVFGQDGPRISIDRDQWQRFNPQIIYTCNPADRELPILEKAGWNQVEAVRNQKIFFFPCELTCCVSTNAGFFVSWLGASIHQDYFSNPDNQLRADRIIGKETVHLSNPTVKAGWLIQTEIKDFRNKSLLIALTQPTTILSTLEGWREDIRYIGNHYFPPPAWGLDHQSGLAGLKRQTYAALGRDEADTSMLFTGADMDNLAIAAKSYKAMQVTALVTAGVSGNSMKMAADTGEYYELEEPHEQDHVGTINIIVLTNTRLSPRAMTRALITITEAKTAALRDLDIRSSYSGIRNAATGTGTDNILLAQGDGRPIDNSGGHSKMGELIATAVYQGVMAAVLNQNELTARRSVYQRANERGIQLSLIGRTYLQGPQLISTFEQLLREERYQSFLHAAFAINDAYEAGLVTDLSAFRSWCEMVAREIGGEATPLTPAPDPSLPAVLQLALGAIISGVAKPAP